MKKFEKIVTWIQEEVRSGRMVSGEKLPSEQELSEQFRVSRQTVRRALEELVKENIVESRRGSGSYICEDAGMLLGNTERRADHGGYRASATEGEDESFREDAAGGGAAQQQEYDSCSDISGN